MMRHPQPVDPTWLAVFAACLTLAAAPAAAQLPQSIDSDRDGFYNELETALGSDPANRLRTPESRAVAGSCGDFRDNDGDGLVDGDDPGCAVIEVSSDLEERVYAFDSLARLGPGTVPGVQQEIELTGPTVMRTSIPDGNESKLEMVAMQLSAQTPRGPVFLIEDPRQESAGNLRLVEPQAGLEETAEAPRFTSDLNVSTVMVQGNEMTPLERYLAQNEDISFLPPVQGAGKIDPRRCYNLGGGGLHCPRVPVVRIPVFKWVAKFDCGEQPSTPPPFWGPVKPGDYATKIVIHNPQDRAVRLKKKVSEGKRNPKYGPISRYEHLTLPPNRTTEVDCYDIFRLLRPTLVEGQPLPFKNGVVEIVSQHKLDVIANYTLETPKEKIEFMIERRERSEPPPTRKRKRYDPPPPPGYDLPPEIEKILGRRWKLVTLVTEDTLIDEMAEIEKALKREMPQIEPNLDKLRITILGDDLGVGASLDVEAIKPQKCTLIDPPELPEGKLECKEP